MNLNRKSLTVSKIILNARKSRQMVHSMRSGEASEFIKRNVVMIMANDNKVRDMKMPGEIKVLQDKKPEVPKPAFNSRWRMLGGSPKKDK